MSLHRAELQHRDSETFGASDELTLLLFGLVCTHLNFPLEVDYDAKNGWVMWRKFQECLSDTGRKFDLGVREVIRTFDREEIESSAGWETVLFLTWPGELSTVEKIALRNSELASQKEKDVVENMYLAKQGDPATGRGYSASGVNSRSWCSRTLDKNLTLRKIPSTLPKEWFRVRLQTLAFISTFQYEDAKREMAETKKSGRPPSRNFIITNRDFFRAWTAFELSRNPSLGFEMFAAERDTKISRNRDLVQPRSIYTDACVSTLSFVKKSGQLTASEFANFEKWLAPNSTFSEAEVRLYFETRKG